MELEIIAGEEEQAWSLVPQNAGGHKLALTADEDNHKFLYSNPVTAYLDTLGSEESKRVMRSHINAFTSLFPQDTKNDEEQTPEGMNWAGLNRHALLHAIQQRKKAGISPSAIAAMLSAIRGVAHEAWQMNLIRTDVYLRVKQTKAPKGSTLPSGRALPMEEFESLLAACRSENGPTAVRDHAMISVLMICGLRRSELVSLDIEDFDRDECAIKVVGKGNKERLAYLDEETMMTLTEWIDEYLQHESGPIFVRVRRGDDITRDRLSDQSVRFILENRSIQAGIKIARPHDMRRSFITHLLENNVDPLTVQKMAGHVTLQTTTKYDKRGDKQKKDAVASFRKKSG